MLTVTVTQEHIRKGRRRVPDCCPTFHALRPLIKDEFDICVLHGKVITSISDIPQRFRLFGRIVQGREVCNHRLPSQVSTIITQYDRGRDMEPFEFKFKIPKKFIK